MDSENEKYTQDKRMPCKYGKKCYQKNPAHHEKYKHPTSINTVNRTKDKHFTPALKKLKTNTKAVTSKTESDSDDNEYHIDDSSSDTSLNNQKANNDVSDSEDETHPDAPENIAEIISEQPVAEESHQNSSLSEESKETVRSLETEEECSSFIKDKFLVTMPDDFYQFWHFCNKIKPNNPLEALKEVGLYLVGPFDVLAGKFSNTNKSEADYLVHWRYFRDPPELQTVLRSDDPSGYHIGYFRDSPSQLPVLLVSNYAKKNGVLTQMGGNIFSAVNIFLEDLKKSGNPFKKMAIGKIQTSLLKDSDRLGLDMSKKTKDMVTREKKIVTRTFNKIGLVVPMDKKTQVGYRPLTFDNKTLDKYLTKLQNANTQNDKEQVLSELQPVFTFASIATDECDFGTGIELGWNIISHGIDSLNGTAERFLVTNYKLLNMDQFAKIAEAHMRNRRDTLYLSIL
ncbi:unnamed protein product [Phyllotreta striolata]|uniref:PBZ-type domain-containing protein n=1 Tax=Phyllotreta striolata TaxID=444603 RepID=A0A9N9XQ20_PHYSR|nr:unnamed protein product [Phyllotreta striolata]